MVFRQRVVLRLAGALARAHSLWLTRAGSRPGIVYRLLWLACVCQRGFECRRYCGSTSLLTLFRIVCYVYLALALPLTKWAVLELLAWVLTMLLLLMVSCVEAVGAVPGSNGFRASRDAAAATKESELLVDFLVLLKPLVCFGACPLGALTWSECVEAVAVGVGAVVLKTVGIVA